MGRIWNRIITKFKGEEFLLDRRIPMTYLGGFIFQRLVMLIVGIIKMRRIRRIFVHPSSIIRCKSKIHYGMNLTIDRSCYIDALSVDGLSFGNNVSIGKYTTIECTGTLKSIGKGMRVGNNVGLGTHGFFGCAGGVEIGDDKRRNAND